MGAIATAQQFRSENMTKKLISLYEGIIAQKPDKYEKRKRRLTFT